MQEGGREAEALVRKPRGPRTIAGADPPPAAVTPLRPEAVMAASRSGSQLRGGPLTPLSPSFQ